MALYVASHYKVCIHITPVHSEVFFSSLVWCWLCFLGTQNSPNDLQMLSDAPAHHLFCLLPPVPPTQNSLPEVLAVVQVGRDEILFSAATWRMSPLCIHLFIRCFVRCVWREKSLGSPSLIVCPEERRPLGTSSPGRCQNRYTLLTENIVSVHVSMFQTNTSPLLSSLQFQDSEFASLSGGRVVRIAVNPDYQGVRCNKQLQRVNPGLHSCLCSLCDLSPPSPPDGLRLQSSSASADVLWGQVSHHGWEHAVQSQWDHLRQQWGNTSTGSWQTSGAAGAKIQLLRMRWGRFTAHVVVVVKAVSLLEEVITPRKELPPLLLKLSERRAERLDYLGVSYGLTAQLLK